MNRAGVECRRDLAPLNAVIYLPPGLAAVATWQDTCAQYCARRRYQLAGFVTEWTDLTYLLLHGEADVAVVGRRDHLPRNRTPRIDVVVEERMDLPPTQRRPRRM